MLEIARRVAGRAIGAAILIVSGSMSAAGQTPVAGQMPPLQRVEFDEAVARAIERNPTVAQAATNIAQADALLRQTRAQSMPTVSGGLTNTTLDGSRGFEGSTFQPQNQFGFTANATLPFLAASRWAATNHARDQIEVATTSATEVRKQVGISAAQAYLAVIAAKRQVEVGERALETARAHLDYATKRFEGGIGSRLNQVRAAVVVTADDGRLEVNRLALRTAQEALGVILAADGPVDAGEAPVFEVPATIDEAQWMTNRPDVQTQLSIQRAAERVLADSSKDWWPMATASFDPVYIAPAGLFQPSNSWRLGVNVIQPIFDGGQRRAAKSLRDVSVQQSKLAMTDLQIRARSEVRLAQESLRSLQYIWQTARQAVEQSNEVLRITTSAFEVGATTNIEVIDAQRASRDAETAAALAEDAVRRAHLELLVAMGRFPK
jgi:outer membrane protein TolC